MRGRGSRVGEPGDLIARLCGLMFDRLCNGAYNGFQINERAVGKVKLQTIGQCFFRALRKRMVLNGIDCGGSV